MFEGMDPAMLLEALKAQVPGIKTQAQLNAFLAAFDSLRLVVSCIFNGDEKGEENALLVLKQTLDLAKKVTDLSNKYAEVPEAAQGVSNSFTQAPNNLGEYDTQKRLLTELEEVKDLSQLTEWYARTKDDREKVVSQVMRNVLLDAIRAKKMSLS
jgi:hypothetical protein